MQKIEQATATIRQSQPAAIVDISTTKPKLAIDATEARASVDLKSIRRRIEEHAQYGRQAAMEGLGRRAKEGRQLMEIERGGQKIAEIAAQYTSPTPAPIGIQFSRGSERVHLTFEPGTIDIRIRPHQPIFQVDLHQPIHDYTPGKVQTVVHPHPSIRIDVKR